MKGNAMATYTVSITGAGALAPRFETMLDVLRDSVLVGWEESKVVTLYFDVTANSDDHAIEVAFLRAYALNVADDVTLSVVPSHTVEGRGSWWRKMLGR